MPSLDASHEALNQHRDIAIDTFHEKVQNTIASLDRERKRPPRTVEAANELTLVSGANFRVKKASASGCLITARTVAHRRFRSHLPRLLSVADTPSKKS